MLQGFGNEENVSAPGDDPDAKFADVVSVTHAAGQDTYRVSSYEVIVQHTGILYVYTRIKRGEPRTLVAVYGVGQWVRADRV